MYKYYKLPKYMKWLKTCNIEYAEDATKFYFFNKLDEAEFLLKFSPTKDDVLLFYLDSYYTDFK